MSKRKVRPDPTDVYKSSSVQQYLANNQSGSGKVIESLQGFKQSMIANRKEPIPTKELVLQINIKDRAMSYAKIQLARSQY